MPVGRVKWFNEIKGYGLITTGSGADVTVKYADIAGEGFRTLDEHEKVRFEVVDSPFGPRAMNVCRCEPE